MSDRKLRNGAKKDYKKLASGEDSNSECEELRSADENNNNQHSDGEQNKNVNKAGCSSTSVEIDNNNCDFGNGVVKSVVSSSEESEDDDDLKVAEDRLKALKRERKKILKAEKLKHIAQETEEIEKQLKHVKGKNKKRDEKTITIASLRGMSDVVGEVDKLMDKKFNLKSVDSSGGSSSSSLDSTDSDSDTDGKEQKKSKKKSDAKGGKHKSGKSKKLTSYVPFPQKWPHSHLTLHFVSKEKKFEELSIAEFCAGYVAILEMSQGSIKAHRTAHLKELMYLATRYQWRHVLNYHAACLMEIERGHLKWGDSFQLLQSTTLAGGILPSHQSSSMSNWGSNAGSRSSWGSAGVVKEEGTVFCHFYQRGACSHASDHQGFFQGEKRLLKHICAECWLKTRKLEVHPRNSEACPLK